MTLDLSAHKAALEGYFRARPGVVLAYLFGSYARGQAGPLSDVDIIPIVARLSVIAERVNALKELQSLTSRTREQCPLQ